MKKCMEEAVEPEHGVSPGVLGLLAFLSIGGLLFVGWQASITGQYTAGPYSTSGPFLSCCTVEPWGSSITGYNPGTGITSTEVCTPTELPQRCCVRAARDRYNSPVRLLYSHEGTCVGPEVNYPFGGEYSACCSVQTWRSAPTGFIQSEAETSTERCTGSEAPQKCCARNAASRTQYRVRVLGAKLGDCNPPETAYPAPIPGGYTACCSGEMWLNAPTGYSQGTAQRKTGYCDPVETLSQCCARSVTQNADYPMKLLGFKFGSCEAGPERSYPAWIRYPT